MLSIFRACAACLPSIDRAFAFTDQPFAPSGMLSSLPPWGGTFREERSDVAVNPVMLVHGGAWAIPDDMVEAHIRGVEAAAAQGWEILQRSGTCIDAIEAAVVAMEE